MYLFTRVSTIYCYYPCVSIHVLVLYYTTHVHYQYDTPSPPISNFCHDSPFYHVLYTIKCNSNYLHLGAQGGTGRGIGRQVFGEVIDACYVLRDIVIRSTREAMAWN